MGRYDDEKKNLSPVIIIGGIVVIVVVLAWIVIGVGRDNEEVVSELTLPYSESVSTDVEAESAGDANQVEEFLSEAETPQEMISEPLEPLPPLDKSDDLVRREVQSLSPDLGAQVQETELIEKYLQVINDFSQGQRLYKHIRFLQLEKPFVAEQDNKGWYIAEESYQRYDRLAKAFAMVDTDKAIGTFQRLRPLLQQAYAEFGYPEEYQLEDLFKKAAAEMIAAPVVDGRIALVKPTLRFKYADEKLEALSPVQKQMLRMGPKNTRIIQKKLRELVQEMAHLQNE